VSWIWPKGGSLLTPVLSDSTSKKETFQGHLLKKSINIKWYLLTIAMRYKPDTLPHTEQRGLHKYMSGTEFGLCRFKIRSSVGCTSFLST